MLPELKTTVTVSEEEICLGESSVITVTPSGGIPDAKYSFSWSNNLFPQSSNTVIPATTTTYYIQTSDGCSDDVIDSVTIKLSEIFSLSFNTNEKLCIGEEGYIKANVNGNSNYQYEWNGPKRQSGDSILGKAGDIYEITVTDLQTGCTEDTIVKIPSFKNISASFLINPNFDCIPSNRKNVIFIDVSNNGVTGMWKFGTGDSISYVPGVNPQYTFTEAGFYMASLTIQNEGWMRRFLLQRIMRTRHSTHFCC